MENLMMYKSDLNSYCRRTNIPLPVYDTRFACTVTVGGKTFTSSSTFTDRISAEQDAAKVALQHLLNDDTSPPTSTNLRFYLRKLVCQHKARCKMILNEFIDKTKMECAYETVQVEKAHVFVSSLVLNGTYYRGECGKNKKEAEQLAALAAILSLLDDPIYGTQISEVIKSKFSACDVFNVLKDCSVTSNEFKPTTSKGCDVIIPLSQQSCFRVLVDHQKPTSEEQGLVNSLPQIENQVSKTSLPQTEELGGHGVLFDDDTQCVSGHLPGAVTISRCSYVPLPITSPLVSEPQYEIKLPEATQLRSRQIGVPTEFVLIPPAAHNPGKDLTSSKKRPRKNKKKANKRRRAENKLQ
ncbi:Double-stranded RNA-binding domain-containing protein [Hirschfeldia incana]|nr:Double-stranded RNA-binding domain-containing protein [Hirschfeldia incana]